MLYISWFLLLTIVAWVCLYKSHINNIKGNSSSFENYLFGYFIASAMSFITSWEVIGKGLYGWLANLMYNTPDEIKNFTIYSVLVVVCLAWVIAPVLLTPPFVNKDGDISFKKQQNKQK